MLASRNMEGEEEFVEWYVKTYLPNKTFSIEVIFVRRYLHYDIVGLAVMSAVAAVIWGIGVAANDYIHLPLMHLLTIVPIFLGAGLCLMWATMSYRTYKIKNAYRAWLFDRHSQ